MQNYITVYGKNSASYTEKHSVFYATVTHIENEEEFGIFLSEIKKQYFDAKHYVFAYILKDNYSRFSDDKEPHGTAGKPVLDVLTGSGLKDVGIIVARHFGGVLLGTGGLVRAYSAAAKMCIETAEKCKMSDCERFITVCSYAQFEEFEKLIENFNGIIIKKDFTEFVEITYSLTTDCVDVFKLKLTEKFNGNLKCDSLGHFFTISEKFI